MCKEMLVIPVSRVVDPKIIIGKTIFLLLFLISITFRFSALLRMEKHFVEIRTQSYDFDLQRQGCKLFTTPWVA
jgi:hypothetical protein